MRHSFSFDGGDELTTLGASWFVSYMYFCEIDKTHRNWSAVSTARNRISVFNRSTRYHQYWLSKISEMSDDNLNKNKIGLTATSVKTMVKQLCDKQCHSPLESTEAYVTRTPLSM